MASPGVISVILTTLTSLNSCLVNCSTEVSSRSTTMVTRLKASSSVGATASEMMLKPRRAKRAEIRARTPARFSTIMEMVWWWRRPLPETQVVHRAGN